MKPPVDATSDIPADRVSTSYVCFSLMPTLAAYSSMIFLSTVAAPAVLMKSSRQRSSRRTTCGEGGNGEKAELRWAARYFTLSLVFAFRRGAGEY